MAAAVEEGEFREDLYYRLAVVPIHLPPLRQRAEEIPDLVSYFLERHRHRLGIEMEGVAPKAMEVLMAYPWPGNIRELENLLEQAMVLAEGAPDRGIRSPGAGSKAYPPPPYRPLG